MKRLWRWLSPRLTAFWMWTGLLATDEQSAEYDRMDRELRRRGE